MFSGVPNGPLRLSPPQVHAAVHNSGAKDSSNSICATHSKVFNTSSYRVTTFLSPLGEKERKPFQLIFNGLLKVDFHGSRVTSDGGLILVRELAERLGLGTLIDEHPSDSREGLNKKFPLADLLRQSFYSRLAGYEDLNDAARVAADPTFRLIGSEKNWNRGAALTSTSTLVLPPVPDSVLRLVLAVDSARLPCGHDVAPLISMMDRNPPPMLAFPLTPIHAPMPFQP